MSQDQSPKTQFQLRMCQYCHKMNKWPVFVFRNQSENHAITTIKAIKATLGTAEQDLKNAMNAIKAFDPINVKEHHLLKATLIWFEGTRKSIQRDLSKIEQMQKQERKQQ